MSISQSIFNIYDILVCGIIEDELTPDTVKLIGQVIVSEFIAKSGCSGILIA